MKLVRCTLVTALVVLVFSAVGPAQSNPPIDVDKLTTELQKSTDGKDDLNLVWWIPEEYWRAILEQEKLSKAQIDEFVGMLRSYTIVAVFDGKLGPTFNTTYRTEAQIRNTMLVIDANGTEYAALTKDKIGPAAASFMDMVRPLISNALGKLGANFHFLVFPGLNAKNDRIVDPTKNGSLTIRLQPGKEVSWQLPLASLVPPKKCPVDGQLLNGTWRYCPWHGTELK